MEKEVFTWEQFERLVTCKEKDYPYYFFLKANANYCKLMSATEMEYHYFNIEKVTEGPGPMRPVLRRTIKKSSKENITIFLLMNDPVLITKQHYESLAKHFEEAVNYEKK